MLLCAINQINIYNKKNNNNLTRRINIGKPKNKYRKYKKNMWK